VQLGITTWAAGLEGARLAHGRAQAGENQDLWEELDALAAGHEIEWHWVKGHSGNRGNERCDQLANAAIDALLG